jgi:hypothetical protein
MKFKIVVLLLALLPISVFSEETDWSAVPFKEGQTIREEPV